MPHTYATVETFREYLEGADADHWTEAGDLLLLLLEAASGEIDGAMHTSVLEGWHDAQDTTITNLSLTQTATEIARSSFPSTPEVGQSYRVEEEDLYVVAVASDGDATVRRGQNDTDAAQHSSATLERYFYPSDVTHACLGLARLAWRERDVGRTQQVSLEGAQGQVARPGAEAYAIIHRLRQRHLTTVII